MAPIRSVLFVSSTDTARSPFAAGFAELTARTSYRRKWKFRTAGVQALTATPAAPLAVNAARRWGVDLRKHRGVLLSRELMDQSDLTLDTNDSVN